MNWSLLLLFVAAANASVLKREAINAEEIAESLRGVLSNLKNKFEEAKDAADEAYGDDLREALGKVNGIIADASNRITESEEYQKAKAQAEKLRDELEAAIENRYGITREDVSDFVKAKLGEVESVLGDFTEKAKEAGRKALETAKDWWQKWGMSRERRELKSFQQMTPEERAQQNALIAELKEVLRKKFGQQDPDEDARLSPETRERLAAVRKEFLQKHGAGYDDETDDEWREKYGQVIDELNNRFQKRGLKGIWDMTPEERAQQDALINELKEVFKKKFGRQRRELKSFQQMTEEERAQQNALIHELKEVLRKKFGQQDPDEDNRLSPETRERLAALRKEFLQKHGAGYDDETDDEWREKYGEVIDELKSRFQRDLKGYNEMTEDERAQHEALLAELRQRLREKFGQQDQNEGLRPSMETRQKLKQVLKQLRKDQGYEDLTDNEWREKYQKVIDELKSRFA